MLTAKEWLSSNVFPNVNPVELICENETILTNHKTTVIFTSVCVHAPVYSGGGVCGNRGEGMRKSVMQ